MRSSSNSTPPLIDVAVYGDEAVVGADNELRAPWSRTAPPWPAWETASKSTSLATLNRTPYSPRTPDSSSPGAEGA